MNQDSIIFFSPDSTNLRRFKAAIDEAVENHRHFRVTVDGGLKFKVGEGEWSPPVPSEEPHGGYPKARP